MPLYYISAEEYSKKMQAASMPNAIAFVAHRSRFHLPSKPLGIEVVVPMIGGGRSLVYLLTFLVFPSAYLTM